jgi:hypothetical protein
MMLPFLTARRPKNSEHLNAQRKIGRAAGEDYGWWVGLWMACRREKRREEEEEGGESIDGGEREEWRGVCVCVTVGAGPERLSVRTDTLVGRRLGGRNRSVPLVSSEL